VRALIREFDAWLCRHNRIFIFCEDPDCMLRLQFARAPHAMQLEGMTIARGETVLAIHIWNDRLPRVATKGADFNWAVKTVRMYRYSLHLAARYVGQNASLPPFRAVMGETSLFAPPAEDQTSHPMGRFGFTVAPYRGPLGRFGEFWENFYAWLLIWAYNPVSARGWNVFTARRSEIWMTAQSFMKHYGSF
jgi:hypothetical protein